MHTSDYHTQDTSPEMHSVPSMECKRLALQCSQLYALQGRQLTAIQLAAVGNMQ
jgi:hypothetical protein